MVCRGVFLHIQTDLEFMSRLKRTQKTFLLRSRQKYFEVVVTPGKGRSTQKRASRKATIRCTSHASENGLHLSHFLPFVCFSISLSI